MRGGQLAGWLAGWLVAGVMGAHVGAAAQSMGDGLGEVYPGGMVAARAVGVRGEMKCSTGGETWVVGVARSETSHSYRPYSVQGHRHRWHKCRVRNARIVATRPTSGRDGRVALLWLSTKFKHCECVNGPCTSRHELSNRLVLCTAHEHDDVRVLIFFCALFIFELFIASARPDYCSRAPPSSVQVNADRRR